MFKPGDKVRVVPMYATVVPGYYCTDLTPYLGKILTVKEVREPYGNPYYTVSLKEIDFRAFAIRLELAITNIPKEPI